ncbi:MAG: class I SAM-dependent methyltransferase [Sphaerochaetaceae bacterium]|nr:class I SAM-dependent methyltransferase [Sphaerochaetaceae bacterium]MDD4258638.1 class I SAM-dependent methyltransferase [Sphaerochaetaceae bacterium]MDD4842254.1 class I SAM-dependent methyltransferase [Sphaerochaetaceae bacterium]
MHTVEEKLAKSLTAESIDLIPYLPYLLQDLWQLGSSPNDMIEMLTKHTYVSKTTRVLDLACGKGAVSVTLADTIGCSVKGIDILPEFIDYAINKAHEFGVEKLCEFIIGDINESVKIEKEYDVVIFGAIGEVLGDPEQTITFLKNTVKKGGYILLDDAYSHEETDGKYQTREQWIHVFNNTGVKLIAEKIMDEEELTSINNEQQELIIRRAEELKTALPERAQLFDGYIHSQQEECEELKSDVSGVTMLLQVIN